MYMLQFITCTALVQFSPEQLCFMVLS